MPEVEKTKEELISEIESLKKLLDEKQSNENPELNNDSAGMMDQILSGMLQHSGFDLNNIQLEYVNLMINNIPNPAYVMNDSSVFIGCNKHYEEFVGTTSQEIIGKELSEFFPPEMVENEMAKDRELFDNGGIINYDVQLTESNGKVWDLVFSKSVFKNFDGTTAGLICVINDITEKRMAERALYESEQKLREANATKDKFFSIISHDLKSPFVTLLGMTEILDEDYDSLDEEERKGFISDIHNAANKAFSLIQNLLEWANVQRGRLKLEPEVIDVTGIITEVIELVQPTAKVKKVNLVFDGRTEKLLYIDRNTVSTIFRNLISNAVKFNRENGEVSVTIEESDDYVFIKVKDTGIGIAEKDLEKLFRIDVSHKTIGTSRENKGTGLGLILCKEFVERNNGVISFSSEFGVGTLFTVKFLSPKVIKN